MRFDKKVLGGFVWAGVNTSTRYPALPTDRSPPGTERASMQKHGGGRGEPCLKSKFSACDGTLPDAISAELKGPQNCLRIRPDFVDLGPKSGPPNQKKPRQKCPGRAHKPAQTDSDRFRTGSVVFRPRSKVFGLRNKSAVPLTNGNRCRNSGTGKPYGNLNLVA